MSPQLALPGTTGAAAIRPDGPNGRVADRLDAAKAASRRAWDAAKQGEQNFFVFWEPIMCVAGPK